MNWFRGECQCEHTSAVCVAGDMHGLLAVYEDYVSACELPEGSEVIEKPYFPL